MRRVLLSTIAALSLCLAPSLVSAEEGDAAKGKQVFAKCQACHSLEEGANKVGPSLYHVFDREAGTLEGFKFSSAMQESNITWDDATLDEYLASPKKLVPGTKMVFPGLPKVEDRANVIAYMKESGGAAE